MNLSRPFIVRPVATTLLMAALLLAGGLAYRLLPVSALPEVDYPTIQVVTFYPGASAEVTASSVTAPLERQFGQMPGLQQMTSTSSGGASVIVLQFVLNLGLDVAEQEVQAAINAALTLLPPDLPTPPVYSKVNPADAPILTLGLTSSTLPLTRVEDLADTRLAQKIAQLPGVGLVSIAGGQRPAVRVQANPAALAAYGLTLEDLRAAIAAANVNQAKGSFDGPRQSSVIGANDQLLTSRDYRPIVVAYRNGAPVTIGDVADVIDGAENARQAAWMNGEPAVIVNIQRQPGANVIAVADRIKQLLPQLGATLPAAVKVSVLTDRTVTIRGSVEDVQLELALSVGLVVLVVFLFLRTLAGTVIPSVAVPLSLIGTFGAMVLLGFSLNNLSLMALTIATGFVVDDAIVMIENIARYVEAGRPPLEAALEGARQIGFTILSLTVSLVAVLIPLLFMADVVGRLFREFAVTLGITILISAAVSLTLTPMMCARLLRHTPPERQGRLYRWSEEVFARIIAAYGRTLRWVLAHQAWTLAVAGATLVLTGVLYVAVPKGFFPVQDTGVIQGISEAPSSVSFSAMAARQQALAQVILRDPAVDSLSSFIGVDGVNTSLNSGRILINLKPLDERRASAGDVIRRLAPELAKVDGIALYMQPVQDLTVEDRVSRTQYQYTLEDPDGEELGRWAPRLYEALRHLAPLADVGTDQADGGLGTTVLIDRSTASRLGVTPAAIDNTLYDAFGQRQVSTMFTQLNQYRVVLEVQPSFRRNGDALRDIYVRGGTAAQPVAAPLERQFGHIAGVTEMTSTSYLGSTNVVLQFDLGRDINGAARDVQAAINAARGDLPPALPNNPTYRKVNPADAPILILALTSDTLGRGEMYDAASSLLEQKLSQVPGVGQVIVGGAALPAVRVELNPLALDRYGIGLEDVRAALGATNVNRPKGLLDDGDRARQIQANDQLRRAEDYAPVIVAYQNGRPVRIEDVGRAEDSVEDVRNAGLSDGKPAVVVVIFRQPGANIIDTVDRVRALVPRFHAVIPAAIDLSVVLDRSSTIRASLRDVEWTLAVSVALVTLVVFAFLRSARTTAIPAVAVPVSLVGTFGAMYLLGYSLNNLSLMALTIATGFVIDDAIVVLENITRHREAGLGALESALLGAREIGFTVLSMSASLVAVFIPILLMGGVVGRLFREFAMTLSIAIAISLLVSLTTTPMLCAALLGGEARGSHGAVYRLSERGFEWVRRQYERTLRLALRHQPLVLAAALGTIALNGYLFAAVPKGFFPQQDTGRLTGTIRAAQDISFQAMQDKLGLVVDIIARDPAVDGVIGFTGGGGNTGATVNTARMFVALKPLGERGVAADQVIARLRGRLAAVPGAPTFLQAVQDLRVGGMASAAQYQYTLRSDDLAALDTWGPRVAQRLAGVPGLADLNSDQQDKGRQSSVVIDRATASRLGLTPQLVDDTLYDAFGQRQVSTMYTPLNQYHVVMEVAPRFWQRPETLADIYLRAPSGAAVPLAAFTRYEPTTAALAVSHQGQFPSVTISFNLAPGASLGAALEAIQEATRQIGLPANIQGSFQGTAQAFQASLAGEPLLILAALLAVYVALGVLYESYVHPLTILSTLPSAGVGALLALLLFRTDLTVIALIGIVLLIGIVKKNAIMMIDFALDAERREGRSPEDAIFQACLLRFRPITMTTMAALLGALPLALGTGVGSELRRPLGIAIVGGLIVSQMLTLYTTPVVYLWLGRVLGRRRRISRAPAAAGGLALLLIAVLVAGGGCTVGPSYVRPTVVAPAAYKETDGWKIARPQDDALRGDWWRLFGDAELDALEPRVSVSNQSLAGAEATYREARALVREARAGYFPTVTVGAGYTRFRSSANTAFGNGNGSVNGLAGGSAGGGPQSDFQLPFDASWTPDFWGKVRRTVESNQASAQASAGDVETARLSLQAELAQDYFQLRALDAQSDTLSATVAAFEKSLQLTRDRYASGVASGADVAQALTQLKTTQAQAIDVGVQRAQLEHAIALLVGEPASTFAIARTPLSGLPPDVPVGVPSELLERRPDVAAAERRVAAANAAVGVAVAAFYPTVTLSVSAGFQSGSLAQWLAWPSRFWSVGPGISETVYDGGLRSAQTDQARAAYDGSVATYRQTVLTAFQGVEDNLAALRILEDEARVQDEAVEAATRSLTLTTDQYKAGIVSYLNVVVAQTALLTNQTTAVAIHGRRMTATVLLIQALGGGWETSRLPSAAEVTRRAGNP